MRTPTWKIIVYSAILIAGFLLALPNVLTDAQLQKLPGWLPHQRVTLGLDLRGGSHLVLEVDAKTLIKDRLQNIATDSRHALLSDGIHVKSARISGNDIMIGLADAKESDAALKSLRKMNNAGGGAGGFGKAAPELDISGQPGGNIKMTLTEAGISQRVSAAVEQSLEIVRRRIDQIGVSEPTIQRVGSDRILVQLPGLQDPTRLRELLGSTAKMTFHLLSEEAMVSGKPTRGVTMMPGSDGQSVYPVENRVMLDGDHLTDAQSGFNQQTGEPIVSFRFDSSGARAFGRITKDNVGKPFAIVLDGKVLSAPVIREPIMGGTGQISGNFTVEETATLSALLRAGALPAPLTVIEERTVGPDLGADAINMGLETGLIGFGLVFAFIFFLYSAWGLIALTALLLNVVLTFAALSMLGATLTLPGIAGIILTIGIAVDANVLINERIREETEKGLSSMASLNAGFKHAYATIIDSHMTGLIATLLLFQFGSGPVKGFAVTMSIGILISLFTAVAVVRVVMTELVYRRRSKPLHIHPIIRFVPENTNIHFMKARYMGIIVSAILSTASIVLFFKPGLNYGIDFKGGIQIEIQTQGDADMHTLRTALEGLDMGEMKLQEFGAKNDVMIRAERQPGGETAQSAAVATIKDTIGKVSPGVTFQRTEVVGPKISGELARSGSLAMILASLAITAYIWWRFEWPFAIGAIVTLVLDTTKTVGFFALTGLDFNLTAVAALLTLIGYSVNDKVVVYDRMRENMRLYKSMPLREIIDKSINQTLARSIYTSATAFLVMIPMAIWGGSAVNNFAIPMVFGIFIATSSSIFIAAPILLFIGDWRKKHHAHLIEQAAE